MCKACDGGRGRNGVSEETAYRMSTCPRLPVFFPLIHSSVPVSWMFMYESTDTSRPEYSVWPHLSRMMTSSLTLPGAIARQP